jgi:hypothetical protein
MPPVHVQWVYNIQNLITVYTKEINCHSVHENILNITSFSRLSVSFVPVFAIYNKSHSL